MTMTLEQRLATVEAEVAQLKHQLQLLQASKPQPNGNWVEQMSGSMKDIPEDVWQEYLECMRQAREELNRPSASED
jgi:hypothetical protein